MAFSRETRSLCPVCLRALPAKITEADGEAVLSRACPEHGEFSAVIWRGEPGLAAWSRPKNPGGAGHAESSRQKGCPHDCGLCEEHRQRGCTVLFEITRSCNLACPVCFASAGRSEDFAPLAELEKQLRWIHSREPDVVLQISGGEPTLHPELPALVRLAAPLFPAVQLNTNGLRLAESPELCRALAEAGLAWVFLQFDGVSDDIYRAIRGRPLLDIKERAVENCRAAGLPVVLVPTLARGVNDGALGDILDFALARAPAVRGLHIQPMAVMGRNRLGEAAQERITLPEVLRLLAEQSGGRVSPAHASPPGCEHERCSFHCRYLLGSGKSLRPLRESACCSATALGGSSCCAQAPAGQSLPLVQPAPELYTSILDSPGQNKHDIEAGRAINTIIRSWGAPGSGTASGGGAGSGADEDALSRFIREAREQTFSITCMAFQDAMTADLERISGCCVHVFVPPARLVPFCSYNLTALDGTPLHRGASAE